MSEASPEEWREARERAEFLAEIDARIDRLEGMLIAAVCKCRFIGSPPGSFMTDGCAIHSSSGYVSRFSYDDIVAAKEGRGRLTPVRSEVTRA